MVGGRRSWEGGLASDALGGGGLASLPTAPLDSGLRRNDDGGGAGVTNGGPAFWEAGLGRFATLLTGIPAFAGMTMVGGRRSDAPRRALPRPSPPLWIPAFAGMTGVGGGRHDEAGAGVQARRLGHQYPRQTTSWYKSLQVGLFASISLIFQALFHSLSAFSLLIALSIVS